MKKIQKDIIFFAVGLLVAVAVWGWVNTPRIYDVQIVQVPAKQLATSTPVQIVKLPEDILKPVQRKWLKSLEWCESRGRASITVLDSNNEYSFGILQFQIGTFMNFGKTYNVLPKIMTREQALLVIHNVDLQEKIAAKMLADGLANHWKVCYHKINEKYPNN